MSLSQVSIINISLSKVGDYYISSLTEGTKQQVFAVLHWENARDSLLESYPWNFATERAQLAMLAASPIGYDHKYQLPNDCLKVQRVSYDGNFSGPDYLDYKVHGRTLLCNEDTVYIQYTKQIVDTSLWTPLFVKAFACTLALLLAEPLGAISTSDKQLIMAEADAYINEARGVDFEEGQNTVDDYYSMISCRDT
jgi:hypothetical protein